MDLIVSQSPVPLRELNPAVHPELERIVGKALEKNRKLRFQTAADLRADLQRLKRDLESVDSRYDPPLSDPVRSSGSSPTASPRRRRVAVAGAVLVGKRADGDRDRGCSNRTSIAAT